MLKRIDVGLRAVADLALPRTCTICGRSLFLFENNLCLECLSDIPYTYFWTSRINPMSDKFNERIQKNIIPGAYEPYVCCAALFFYGEYNSYKNIPQSLKYGANLKSGIFFAGKLGNVIKTGLQFKGIDTVIPVPLHWVRKWRRGYNQSEIIGREIARILGARIETGILKRRRYTGSQTTLTTEEKGENVSGAFRALKKDPSIHHILLVDDTFTSGSTLYECFCALREKYPVSVKISVATLAYVSDGV